MAIKSRYVATLKNFILSSSQCIVVRLNVYPISLSSYIKYEHFAFEAFNCFLSDPQFLIPLRIDYAADFVYIGPLIKFCNEQAGNGRTKFLL